MSAAGEKFCIDTPHLLSRRRRLSDAIATGIMWMLYSYLWVPLISLAAWLLGFEFAYDVMVRAGGISALKDVLWWYGFVLACIVMVVAAWSAVNRYRFAAYERRQSGKIVTDAELAEHFSLEREDLQTMRSARIATVRLDAAGTIERVDASGRADESSQ
ncbi:MAG: poly-beta-1,6-N-acetyl-D-glucosamine biosynthesis protein PgaD [Woeseia sp.]